MYTSLEAMLIKYCKLNKRKIRKIIECFCGDLTAIQTHHLTKINRNTINRYYRIFRKKIADYQESLSKDFKGEVEIDESYFGGRNKGRRGRGTAKIPVFGILKRNGRVYTQIIRNATRKELRPIIKEFISQGSTLYSDRWRAYDGLVFNGYKHKRINHTEQEYSNGKGGHINGLESFWSFSKRRLQKFNGIKAKDFYLHLKECEFRFNERRNIQEKIKQIIKLF